MTCATASVNKCDRMFEWMYACMHACMQHTRLYTCQSRCLGNMSKHISEYVYINNSEYRSECVSDYLSGCRSECMSGYLQYVPWTKPGIWFFGHPTIIRESLKWVCDFLLIHDCPLFVSVHFTVYNPKFWRHAVVPHLETHLRNSIKLMVFQSSIRLQTEKHMLSRYVQASVHPSRYG